MTGLLYVRTVESHHGLQVFLGPKDMIFGGPPPALLGGPLRPGGPPKPGGPFIAGWAGALSSDTKLPKDAYRLLTARRGGGAIKAATALAPFVSPGPLGFAFA